MAMDRIINMTEVDQLAGNEYVHLQSPTLGDRKIKAIDLAGFIIVKETNLEIAHTSVHDYETISLDWEFEEDEYYMISIYDTSYSLTTSVVFQRSNATDQAVEIFLGYGQGWFKINDASIEFWNYTGDYRDIYATISIVPHQMLQSAVS